MKGSTGFRTRDCYRSRQCNEGCQARKSETDSEMNVYGSDRVEDARNFVVRWGVLDVAVPLRDSGNRGGIRSEEHTSKVAAPSDDPAPRSEERRVGKEC